MNEFNVFRRQTGGAVALACGMTALADGSDMEDHCATQEVSVIWLDYVGLRPSLGRVPLVTSKQRS